MQKEENVCEETTLTEDVAEAKENGASTVLGKFKDASALERAYESLQSEFTRRSQKLRELEREVENFKKQSASGVEKLRKNAQARREEAKQFDAFVADTAAASVKEKKPTDVSVEEKPEAIEAEDFADTLEEGQVGEIAAEGIGEAERAEPESVRGKPSAEESGNMAISAEELFERAVKDEAVRLRIVGEYLTSLGKSGAPLTAAGTGVLAAPSVKAKSVGEAGNMALLYFRKAIEQ